MCLRALKIVTAYLENSKVAITEQEVLQTSTLDEKQVKEAIDEALNTLFPTQIENWLRRLNLEQLTQAMYDLVGSFNITPAPKEHLSKELISVKNTIMKSIEEVAKSDDHSIKETAFKYFKSNPTSKDEDIYEYVRKVLLDAKSNVKFN